MPTIQVELLEPKARKLLQELENLRLIKICPANSQEKSLNQLLDDFRSHSSAYTQAEIDAEVEPVRKTRYGRKAKTALK